MKKALNLLPKTLTSIHFTPFDSKSYNPPLTDKVHFYKNHFYKNHLRDEVDEKHNQVALRVLKNLNAEENALDYYHCSVVPNHINVLKLIEDAAFAPALRTQNYEKFCENYKNRTQGQSISNFEMAKHSLPRCWIVKKSMKMGKKY